MFRRRFVTNAALGDWALAVVTRSGIAGCGVAGSPVTELALNQTTAATWSKAMGLDQEPCPYIGRVLDALAQAACRDQMLVPPEPGLVGIAYALRDTETESETALGWGFRPDANPDRPMIATRALRFDQLAGSPEAIGAGAVVAVVRNAARTLNWRRPGAQTVVQYTSRSTPVPPTAWTRPAAIGGN
ncbi:hypothetical protein [Psychromicrobium xiongbiense]|uniref:hypothetical protein n=1 Tax=Psychromicrobium xiongbiense TaxID=3051184 RepID=UPI0025527E7B|nr:hypothetical protein [Psychromicrobium sp. YIM S02556]